MQRGGEGWGREKVGQEASVTRLGPECLGLLEND